MHICKSLHAAIETFDEENFRKSVDFTENNSKWNVYM